MGISETNKQITSQTPAHHVHKIKPNVDFFCWDGFFAILCLLVYLVDIATDIILGIKYLNSGYIEWGILTLVLCVLPSAFIQSISLRWHLLDQAVLTPTLVLSHISLLGIVHRYFFILSLAFKPQKNLCQSHQTSQLLYHYQSDMCLLRLFESFLESAPQLLLQLYIIHELGTWDPWTGICAFGSLISLAWGIASYARTMRNSREDKARITWLGLTLQAVWRTGTMVSRMVSLLLCASVLHLWFLLGIIVHWFGMTIWTIKQKTDLCTTAWEERIYNCVVGVIYCFCFFNIKEGQSRRRATFFYVLTFFENVICVAVFFCFSSQHSEHEWFHSVAPLLVFVGSFLGHSSQLIYYRWFHPSGPITVNLPIQPEAPAEAGNSNYTLGERLPVNLTPVFAIRTLKNMNRKFSGVSLASAVVEPVIVASVKLEFDEKLSIETAESNVPNQENEIDVVIDKIEEISRKNESAIAKTSRALSDSKLEILPSAFKTLTMSKTKSEGEIKKDNHVLLNAYCVKPFILNESNSRSSVASSASVHDYENMAFLNVNRTDWGIRHWKSYSDIETDCHDNSVCKDREQLELSTTSASSTDSYKPLPMTGKLSIEEAIAQLKSLAVHGHNEYQADSCAPKLYDFIWLNESDVSKEIVAPKRLCPTSGHNLSNITEVSETSSTSTVKSKSSLVETVDSIMDKSELETLDDAHLTYVEVSFLSKLSESSSIESPNDPTRNLPRRNFSILREKFEETRHLTSNRSKSSPSGKENVDDCISANLRCAKRSREQSTLSPKSRIFSIST